MSALLPTSIEPNMSALPTDSAPLMVRILTASSSGISCPCRVTIPSNAGKRFGSGSITQSVPAVTRAPVFSSCANGKASSIPGQPWCQIAGDISATAPSLATLGRSASAYHTLCATSCAIPESPFSFRANSMASKAALAAPVPTQCIFTLIPCRSNRATALFRFFEARRSRSSGIAPVTGSRSA